MEDIGYDSHNAINILKTMAILFAFYIARIIIYFMLMLIQKLCKGKYKTKKMFNFIKK